MFGILKKSHDFRKDEGGAITALNLFFLATVALLGGIAIDVSSVISARTQLQATADAAAHAALVQREWNEPEVAKARAIEIATANMPAGFYGDVLKADNIRFGEYDRSTGTFTEDDTSRDAVLVTTERLSSNNNPVGTFLLQFAGLWNWDVRSFALFETYYPTCLMEGFVAEGVVDIQSNNSYFNGFCIHSNSWVEINNNNFFEAGTVVSMPDSDDLVVPETGNGNQEPKNEGLEEALREGKWFIKILNRIDRITQGVQIEDHRFAQDFTTDFNVIDVDVTMNHLKQGQNYRIEPGDLQAGRIYELDDCRNVDFQSGTFEGIVFITNCDVQFSNGAVFEDAVIITSSEDAKSMVAPNNLVLGRNDDCAEGGGAILVTNGGVEVAASLEMHGSQIIAQGNVEFAANADGIKGASIISGGRIDGTSNMNFAFCGSGIEHFFAADYFRLAG